MQVERIRTEQMAAEQTVRMHAERTPAGALRARIALYAAAGTLLFLLERLLPNPFPWIRLGLANVVTLIALIAEGFPAAAAVVVLRLLLGGFFGGTLLGPQFLLAASGGFASLAVMGLGWRFGGRWWSPLGLSVLGACAHGAAQLALVASVFAGGAGVLDFLPLFLGVAIVTGACIGWLADVVLARLELAAGAMAPAAPPS
jgi:uncharacterized membrane protein